jgi:hypothetical protein
MFSKRRHLLPQALWQALRLALWLALWLAPAPAGARSDRVAEVLGRIRSDRIKDDLVALTALGSRFALRPEFLAATQLVEARLLRPGLVVERDPFAVGGVTANNVIAVRRSAIPSSRPAIWISAHYDSISDDPALAPGAEDNASGVAALLEIARVLADEPLATEVHFVAFAAEEEGSWGSHHLVDRIRSAQGLGDLQAVINLDMVGYDPRGIRRILLDGTPIARSLAGRIGDAAALYTGLEVFAGLFSEGRSDHAPFAAAGIPALTVTTAASDLYSCYHTARDLPDRVDPEMVAEVARATAALVLLRAGFADGPPVAAGGDFAISRGEQRIVLSGARSFDPRGLPLLYHWQQIDGPSLPLEGSADAPEISMVPLQGGAYRFQLTVVAPDGRRSEPDLAAVIVQDEGCATAPSRPTGSPLPGLLLLAMLAAASSRARRRSRGAQGASAPERW